MKSDVIHIVGGGLAGSEAAWQAAEAGQEVVLHEMRPERGTDAHNTDGLASFVCLEVGLWTHEADISRRNIVSSSSHHRNLTMRVSDRPLDPTFTFDLNLVSKSS